MIERIGLADVATYPAEPQAMDRLARFNYVYGANGTGKTTISRVIARSDFALSCGLDWKDGVPLETLVYNRDFIEANFNQSPELRGIFTLGAGNIATLNAIEAERSTIAQLSDEIVRLNRTLQGDNGESGKRGDIAALERHLSDKCWELKSKHDLQFAKAFEGVRNNRQNFKERMLGQRRTNQAPLLTLADLQNRAQTLFAGDPTPEPKLNAIDAASLGKHDANPILAKAVVGRDDVDIAAMIDRLGASSWVNQGRALYERNNGICPFCQQPAPDGFAHSLAEYFDEAFERDKLAIDALAEQYAVDASVLRASIATLSQEPGHFLNTERLHAIADVVEPKLQLNLQQLEDKRREPNRRVELTPVTDDLASLASLVDAANTSVEAHNSMVENFSTQQRELTNSVWRYLIDVELADTLKEYDSQLSGLNAAVTNLEDQIHRKTAERQECEDRLRALEAQAASIRPTIDSINGLLAAFGFDSFRLGEAEDGRSYRLERADGSDAKESLSEGERSFVTFLYFYHRLMGSDSETGTTSERVVAFDDPVSSLDSDVLFVVSTLIKRLCEDVRAERGSIKQVFVLTHNVYFHKEITYNPRRPPGACLREESFWLVRKVQGRSQVVHHESNPVTSGYEMLWAEVRDGDASGVTLQNAMRRVLENYFKMQGGLDPDRLSQDFEGEDKLACRALISWIHDGSHSVGDGIMVAPSEAMAERGRRVFREIFVRAGHGAHYDMMMGISGEATAGEAEAHDIAAR